ncbi:MAG: hypothetical protein RI979_1653 [Pseudomonadota bacterium]
MIRNYELRFEIKPGKFVYVPTDSCRAYGNRLNKKLLSRWTPDLYFYHLAKAGGHIAAMRPHLNLPFHASVDLTKFFNSVSRTRVHRALRKIGISNREAFDIATECCVEVDGRKFLPYGFPQSMLLATLVFEKSALGKEVRQLRAEGIFVSVYVDDILLSATDLQILRAAYDRIVQSAETSGFEASHEKSEEPGNEICSFNCSISDRMIIIAERMDRFRLQLSEASDFSREAILRYVSVVNVDQADQLAKSTQTSNSSTNLAFS